MSSRLALRALVIAGAAAGTFAAAPVASAAPADAAQAPAQAQAAQRAPRLVVAGRATRRVAGSAVIRVRTAGRLRARLNGRDVSDAFRVTRAGRHAGRLGANDGLRFGRNRLVLRSVHRGAPSGRRAIALLVSRERPLVGAGADRRIHRGIATRLNGRTSRPAVARQALAYRWQIVEAPDGADPQLDDPDSARPELQVDVPGVYRVRLDATERDGDTATDVATVTALPGDPPIGVRIDTLDDQGRVVIDGRPVANTGGGSGTVSLVVLDRAFRTPEAYSANTYRTNALGTLRADVARWAAARPQSIVIVSSKGGVTRGDLGAADDLFAALRAQLSPGDRDALAAGQPFSIVSTGNVLTGDTAPGSAFVNVGGTLGTDTRAPGNAGSIGGRLRLSTSTNQYGFSYDDYVPFATISATRELYPQQGRMDVGNADVRDVFDGGVGFQAVTVDARTLRVKFHRGYDLGGDARSQETVLGFMLEDLTRGREFVSEPVAPGDLLLIQSFGRPKPATPKWDELARLLASFGGTRTVVNGLDGSSDYALVGSAGQTTQAPEIVSTQGIGEARLTGLLVRRPDGRLTPATADPQGVGRPELVSIAFGPSNGFPAFRAGGQQAANAWIADRLNLVGDDVRRNYWINYTAGWDNLRTSLSRLDTPPADARFTADDLRAVRAQLDDEFARVSAVKTYIGNLQSPFTNSLPSYIDLADISKRIQDVVGAPQGDLQIETFRMFAQAVRIGGTAAPRPMSAVIGVVAGGLVAAGQTMGDDGSQVLGRVRVKTADLGRQLVLKAGAARAGLADLGLLVVSDADKLRAVASKVTRDPEWIWPANDAQILESLRKGSKRWIHEQLMPVAWTTWDLERVGNARDWYCSSSDALKQFHPFKSLADSGQYQPITSFNGATPNRPIVRALGYANSHFGRGDDTARPPSGSVTDSLFRPLDLTPGSDNLGMNKAQFYERAFEHRVSESRYSSPC